MKSLFIIPLLLAVTNGLDQKFVEELMDRLQEVGQACADETHAASDDIAELIARKLPPTRHEGRCMLFCISRNFNLLKADGNINRSGAFEVIAPLKKLDPELYEKVLKIFVYCGMKVKIDTDPCETATNLAVCAQAQANAVGVDETLVG